MKKKTQSAGKSGTTGKKPTLKATGKKTTVASTRIALNHNEGIASA